MNRAKDIMDAQANGYEHVFYIDGKGLCGVYKYLFTFGLAINIHCNGEYWLHDYRYCYSPEDYHTLLMTLLGWSMSTEELPDDPVDSKWIKKKGVGYDNQNPNRIKSNVR